MFKECRREEPDMNPGLLAGQYLRSRSLTSCPESPAGVVVERFGQCQMSPPRVEVMDVPAQGNGGMTLGELAGATVRELNFVSRPISRMQKKGLVKKVRKPGDDKAYVTLSDKGKDICNNIVTEQSIYLIFDALSDKEKEELAALLGKLQSKARALLGLDYKRPLLA